MSIEDGQPYYTDNEQDYFLPYYYLSDSEEQHFSFPEQYLKNVSDCHHITKIHSEFSIFSTNKILEENQSQLKTDSQSTYLNKESQKFQTERFVQQTSPSIKQLEKNTNKMIKKERKHKKIVKNHQKKKDQAIRAVLKHFQQTRQEKIQRYRDKKSKRNWQRGILYTERKKLACRRQRVQGRFQGKLYQQKMTSHENMNLI